MSSKKTSDSDKSLWEAFVKDIKPLDQKAPAKSVPEPENKKPETKPTIIVKPEPQTPAKRYPDLTAGRVDGVQLQTVRRLTQGAVPFEARLDLHGFTQDEAEHEFSRFIRSSVNNRIKCVLVITGKGSRSASGQGVLNKAIHAWVNDPKNRPFILYYNYAKSYHGGQGAFYFLLRTKKSS